MLSDPRPRLRILAVLALVVGGIFILRLYFLQVVHKEKYDDRAQRQYVATVPHLYDRGEIYFQEKNGGLVAAATLSSGYVLALIPTDIEDPQIVATELSQILPTLDREELLRVMANKEDAYEEVAFRIPETVATAIKEKKFSGVRLFRQTWRNYPGDALAAQTIGFVAFDGDVLKGRYGIERYYDDILDRPEKENQMNFFAELFSSFRSVVFDRSEIEEGDVVLTIEPTVQAFLEKEIEGVKREWNSDSAGGIILDPQTGAIYALGSVPSFDLNKFQDVTRPSLYRNPLVESQFEMGSIVKPLTVAAGLDAGVITPSSTYNDIGTIVLNKKPISNYDKRARGPGTTMQMVLNQSLNLGVAHVVHLLGNARFADYFTEKYRLGEETGIDLPGEIAGKMGFVQSPRDVEYATASFGQGIAVTPIGMVSALSVLANKGMTITPHVVSEIRYEKGGKKVISPLPGTRAISVKASEDITRMLVKVVDNALLDGSVKIPEYSVAAKTGTAQMASSGGYYDDRYLHTFFGYFPAYDPKFIVFLYTENPKNVNYASHTLTYPFMRITKFLLHYYDVPPDRGGVTLVGSGGSLTKRQ